MVDVETLARPIVSLLKSFGDGALPTGGPDEVLRTASNSIDAVHALGRTGIDQVESAWSGLTAANVLGKTAAVQTSALELSDRGNSMAAVVATASTDLHSGMTKVQTILASLLGMAADAGQTLSTPAGQKMMLAAATEHLSAAISTVSTVRAQVSTHTAAMTDLHSPVSIPAAPVTTSYAPRTRPVVSTTPISTSKPRTLPKVDEKGVMVTLPDGTTAMAPNEAAAAAVRNALSAQGTPWVLGGNTPGVAIDCSGLTQWAYHEAGIDIPRTADAQAVGMPVDASDLKPGDLAVWDGHVAMVIGNGQLVEAGDPVGTGPIRTTNSGMEFYGFFRPTG